MAITGRQLRNRRVDEYRSSTVSDDVGERQGYLLGSALTLLEYKNLLGSQSRHPLFSLA